MLAGDNLAEVEHVLILSLDDEAVEVLVVPLIPKVCEEEVEHSFVGVREEVDLSSKVEMPLKLLKVGKARSREATGSPSCCC